MRDDLMTRAEAAEYLGMSVSWLRRHTPARGGPAWRRFGRRVVYRRADLDAYIDTPQDPPPAPPPPERTAQSSGRTPRAPGTREPTSQEQAQRARAVAAALRARLGQQPSE
jgi:excisionase family DNA binding protein